MTPLRVPVATYRVQFNKDFRFLDARDVVPYLHELGVSTVYASPRFRARRGSSHGYDVADPLRINSELGTDEEFDGLCHRLKDYGMGLLLDIVPNHMAASHENPWWMDVLENGPSSPFAHYFDIDWQPATSKAAFLQENRVLLPVLADLYGNVLENGEFTLRLDESGFFVRYHDVRLPLDPKSYAPILRRCGSALAESLGREHPAVRQFEQLEETIAQLPARTEVEPQEIRRRLQSSAPLKQTLWRLYRDQPEVKRAIDATLREFNGTPGEPRSFAALHQVLEDQAYRVAFWKIAFEEINYRRFFDINDLVSLRVEDEDVFQARHQIIIQLVKEGKVAGLRVDHVDGLYDPVGYLARLQNAVACGAPQPGAVRSVYVVVEKILGRNEPLPEDWRVCGTTGYDFLNALNDLFINPEGLSALEASYARFTGDHIPFAEICYARNKQVMRKLFAGEVNALGHQLGKLAAQDREARDIPLSELMHALVEVTACLPVYRTYVRDFEVSESDRGYLERTLAVARSRTSEIQVSSPAFVFLRRVLLLELPYYAEDQKQEWLRFVMRWQQFTGPVMAKGLEDTAFYVHNSLISRNEVGGDPLREEPPLDVEGFHRFSQARLEHWPHTMSATSTHDTKRSEDVRARINVFSELAAEWEKHLKRWRRWNDDKKRLVNGIRVPTPSEEVLLYQTLIGAWPLDADEVDSFVERLKGFVIKAVREAKVHSSWIRHNEPHESAVLQFVQAVLERSEKNAFLEDFLRFQRKIARHGALNGLSQVLLKTTAPGVPDFYQGTELWDFSLVDPDNRRPVDFRKRIALLEDLRRWAAGNVSQLLKEILAGWRDGRVKLYLTDKALDFRRDHAQLFLNGDYVPLFAQGPRHNNVCAFGRHKDGSWSLTVTPRWTTRLAASGKPPLGKRVWQDTVLPLPEAAPERWHNALTGETVAAALSERGQKILHLHAILRLFPVALLEGL
jgi:(1->4)-alpha-D-glucan 1-alpha-D-glucosylmutase